MTDTVGGPGSPTHITSTRYDEDGNRYQTVYPTTNASVSTYDLADEPVSTENDPAVLASATHQVQSVTGYDAVGNAILSVDFGGNATTTTVDGDNRVVQTVVVTTTSVVTTLSTVDPNGNVLTTTTQTAQTGLPLQASVDTTFGKLPLLLCLRIGFGCLA